MEKSTESALLFVIMLIGVNFMQAESAPLNCSVSAKKSCPSYLYFVSPQDQSVEQLAAMFRVGLGNVLRTKEDHRTYLINVACDCDATNQYSALTDYVVQPGDGWNSISLAFDGLIDAENRSIIYPQENLELKLLCGCLDDAFVVSYSVVDGDTLFSLTGRFGGDLNTTEKLNGNVSNTILPGQILFFPFPNPEKLIFRGPDDIGKKKSEPKSQTRLIVGIASGVVILVAAIIIMVFYLRSKSMKQSEKAFSRHSQDPEASKHPRKESKPIWSFLPCSFLQYIKKENIKTKHPASFEKGSNSFSVGDFNSDKPVVFSYKDILVATDNLHESKKIGQGSYGAVYLGKLMNQMVAIKQMKDTKSKEFLAELKILSRVHHTNLVELIGFSAGGEHLFLVYEFAENGALSDCLHDPSSKGCDPLSWTSRVQIALDAARGLEYIHEHTKPVYVHRDVKTSNILLDADFRAKIADFGLVKLLEHSLENQMSTTKVVGTFGYLAPEYVRDGQVSAKSDVYAFGVVLMELITGQQALSRSTSSNVGETQSLITLVSSMLKDTDCTSNLKVLVDKKLLQYPEDVVMQMTLLSKACVEDDPHSRPNMRDVVFALSQMLQVSYEWEAPETGETGNSQDYSDFYQCR